MEKVRVGIVGAGENTKLRHIPGFKAIEGVELVGVCNRSVESGRRVAERFGIARVYEDWRTLVEDKEIDAVVIGTWPYMHCAVTVAALEAGKHVLTEARMAMNAAEAVKMQRAAQSRPNLVAQVVPSPMTLRVDKTIKRLIVEGYVGKILALEVRGGGAWIDSDSPMHWRQDFDLSGYNMMSLGIWYEALVRWVGEAKTVSAQGKIFTKMRKDAAGQMKAVRVPEHVDVIADMACGAQLHMQISSVTGLSGQAAAYIFGSAGTLCFEDNRLLGGEKGQIQLHELAIRPDDQGRWRVEEEFINAIRGKEKIKLTTFEDGVKYMAFTEAVAMSIAKGRAAQLSEVISA